MNKKLSILISLILLSLLILANTFRYEQIESTPELSRYIDRWTGIEWVKVISPTGVSRIPAKYYNYQERLGFNAEDVLKDLKRIKYGETALNAGLYISIAAILISVLYAYKGMEKPRAGGKNAVFQINIDKKKNKN